MALRKYVILRSLRSGRLEGRTALVRAHVCAGMTFSLLLVACTVGPDYQRPTAPVPATYKEAAYRGAAYSGTARPETLWRVARPADAIDRGQWWSVFRDPVLDGLERQIDISNQNLAAAEAAFRQAEAIVTQARAGFFPTAQINASAQRSRGGGGGGGGGSSATGAGAAGGAARSGSGTISNFFSITASASWIPDLWGKVRRTVE